MPRNFPKNFFWGASTSSHQVEGNCVNQWSTWEQSPKRTAELERTGLLEKYGHDNFISGRACDHYNRFAEDFTIAQELGHNATRFSIEWSRIEPEEGVFDEKEIAHYQEVIRAARAAGLEPFVTLWHWTLPLWLARKGGWEYSGTPELFGRYAQKMAEALHWGVSYWITINEPEVYTYQSYYMGEWPPQKRRKRAALAVYNSLAHGHIAAYKTIKQLDPGSHCGIAKNTVHFDVATNHVADYIRKYTMDYVTSHYFLKKIRYHQDFIGLNHYFHNRIDKGLDKNKNEQVSDLGWELYPPSMYSALMELARYNRPIIITENGLADAKDTKREWFIMETLGQVHKAITDGIDVRGYLHWSLMDNFEWAHGFWPRFGLLEVDYTTLKRTPRRSAFALQRIIRDNSLPDT